MAELSASQAVVSQPDATQTTPRLLVRVINAPRLERKVPEIQGLVVMIDNGTVGAKLAARLAAVGIQSAIVASDREISGTVAAVVHLAPLVQNAMRFDERLTLELRSLFHLTKRLEPSLRNGGRLLAATRMGGDFLSGWPGSGAVSGFVKALSHEWPNANCRTVDFESSATDDEIADALLRELADPTKLVEVGYQHGCRKTLITAAAPLPTGKSTFSLDSSSVVLVTGGARGITAGNAIELARRFRPILILAGRSPLPSSAEVDNITAITGDKELKAALIVRAKRSGGTISPAAIGRELAEILHSREIRANIQAMKEAGSHVEYHALDVADEVAFTALINDLYTRFGRIDGAIHGAGVIEDKLLTDKTPESFDRVLRPKILPALTMADRLKPEHLKFLVFFSSVSARYGNRGQSDYAAANEVLNKLAVVLNERWSAARVVSINWGPWASEGGMVSPELAIQFQKAGVHLITPEAGYQAFVDELSQGSKSDAEVIWGGPVAQSAPTYPLLDDPTLVQRSNGVLELFLQTTPETHVYLKDHQVDGRPLMPMAMVLELMAEVAAANWPHLRLAKVQNLQVLHGIPYDNGAVVVVRVGAHPLESDSKSTRVRISLESGLGSQVQHHFRADLELCENLSLPAGGHSMPPLVLKNPRSLPMSLEEAYNSWLFHGPLMAGIVQVHQLGQNGIIADLRLSSPRDLFRPGRQGRWLTDPVLVDSALQLLILWSRTYLDQTPLPSRLGSYQWFGMPDGLIRCVVEVRYQPGNPILRSTLRFFDEGSRLISVIEEMEVTCSRALNRLAQTSTVVVVQ